MPLIVTPREMTLRAELYHQLASMTAAGLTLTQSLESLQRNPPNYSFRAPLAELIVYINQGSTFAESMQRLGTWVPAFDVALLQAGEQSGRLPNCFHLLAEYYRERAELINALLMRLAYPVCVLLFALLVFPVNLLVELVRDGNITAFVVEKAVVYGILGGGVFLFVLACQGRHGEKWRGRLEGVVHFIPLLGTAQRLLSIARLSAALEALISAGMPIIEAWEMAADASGSLAIKNAVQSFKPRLYAGQTPAEAISNHPIFPELFANLYHSGEVSGKLDETLIRVHRLFQDEGTRKMKMFALAFSSAIMMAIMLSVAYQIIAFYMGYFKNINDLSQ